MRRLLVSVGGLAISLLVVSGCNNVLPEALEDRIRSGMAEEREKERMLTEVAVFKTEKGSFTIRFYGKHTPSSVRHIRSLIEDRFYDGIRIHRSVHEPFPYIVQFGDPITRGKPGVDFVWHSAPEDMPVAGYDGGPMLLPQETSEFVHDRGKVSMARPPSRPEVGSQLFITLSRQEHLDGEFTVIGEIIDGMDVVEQLLKGDRIRTARLTPPPEPEEE